MSIELPPPMTAVPGVQDLDTTSPETRRYPNQRDKCRCRLSHPWASPQRRDPKDWSKLTSIDPSCNTRCEASAILQQGATRAWSCCRARDELNHVPRQTSWSRARRERAPIVKTHLPMDTHRLAAPKGAAWPPTAIPPP
ncbi:hypothetical protein ZWY2020_018389 [Hordeum vulgare]|nr:hypothetical protein ZWY2020_018389 [Hordeum vulgare]